MGDKMIEQFRSKRFYDRNSDLLQQCTGILEGYSQRDVNVTARQLYYQLVSKGIITNVIEEYKRVCRILKDGRYCGLIDWDAIEDRIRIPHRHPQFDDVLHLVRAAQHSYRLDRWKNQDYYVELFTEKDALSTIIEPICDEWHVFFTVDRGYTSTTVIYDASKRFQENADKECVLLYIGDHDPSGLDMIRDLRERLAELGGDVEVVPIALSIDQVRQYELPPNPAKARDTRAEVYIQQFGGQSWEVDALPPDVLVNLLNDAIASYVDDEKLDKVKFQEKEDMRHLERFAKQLQRMRRNG